MTNQEQYDNMCDKANKYDRIMKELYAIRYEILEHERKTYAIDPYGLVGDCLDIVNKHIFIIQGGD